MKIGIVADPYWPVPPKKYGGTERVIALLIQGLLERNHDVTLFASGNSHTNARLIPITPTNVNTDIPNITTEEINNALKNTEYLIKKYEHEFDIINWHAQISNIIPKITTPVIISLHNPYPKIINQNKNAESILKITNCVTPSQFYQEMYLGPKYSEVIPHGLETDFFTLGDQEKTGLLFIGRFSPEKNPHLAIKAALETGIPITVAAKYENEYKNYYENECKHLLNHPNVNFIGEVTDKEKKKLYQKSKLNLHPISVEETFGLTVLEAGLCGTPSLAFNKGSMKELIRNNINGFVVNTYEELIQKVPQCLNFNPQDIRASYITYSYQKMAEDYEKLFYRIKTQ